jgi:hypothetical protein
VSKYRLEHSDNPDKVQWSLSAEEWVDWEVKDVETELENFGKALPTKVTTPTTAEYRPELDQTKALGPEQATYFAGHLALVHRTRTDRYHCGSVSIVSLSCLSS